MRSGPLPQWTFRTLPQKVRSVRHPSKAAPSVSRAGLLRARAGHLETVLHAQPQNNARVWHCHDHPATFSLQVCPWLVHRQPDRRTCWRHPDARAGGQRSSVNPGVDLLMSGDWETAPSMAPSEASPDEPQATLLATAQSEEQDASDLQDKEPRTLLRNSLLGVAGGIVVIAAVALILAARDRSCRKSKIPSV